MDIQRLMGIVNNSTVLISKGERIFQKMQSVPVLLWNLLLSQTDPEVRHFELVDFSFITVGVNKKQAETDRAAFVRLFTDYPCTTPRGELSYRNLRRRVGSDLVAFRILALGQTLGVWKVQLPVELGFDPELSDQAMDLGLLLITDYTIPVKTAVLHAAAV